MGGHKPPRQDRDAAPFGTDGTIRHGQGLTLPPFSDRMALVGEKTCIFTGLREG